MFLLTDSNCAAPGGMGSGLVQRDFTLQPYGSIPGLPAMALPEFSDQEIEDRIADHERHKSSFFHMREDYGIKSLNQDDYPYCWAFSTTKAIMYLRARANEPMEELSGWMLGSVSSGFVKTGGWCDNSLKTAREVGICSLDEWEQHGTTRSLWNEANKAAAAKRKVTEWSDIPNNDRNMRILFSLLSMNIPVMVEHNRWSHSVCAFYARDWKKKQYDIDNSWRPEWGENGCATLDWVPDNMACPMVVG